MNGVSKRLLIAGLVAATEIGRSHHVLASSGNWDVDRINDNTIFFRNGETLVTELYDVHFIGKLKSEKVQLLIFSGKDCHDCCAQDAIFLYSPAEKKIVEPEYAPYDYPGAEYSVDDSTLLYRSRMFYGKVLPNVPNGIIWYQEMLEEDGQYRKSVYLVRLDKNRVTEQFIFENPPPVEATLRLLKSGECSELEGINYVSEQLAPEVPEDNLY
jgi:hypothetical protein